MRPDVILRAAASYDPETRIFTATFAATAAVDRRDARGPYREVLPLELIDPAALVGRTVFLDHRQSTDAAVGVVLAARREGDAIVGEVQLSAADSVSDIRTKVAEGVIRAVSLGGTVGRWREGRDASGRRTKTAENFTATELSLVGIPADPLSTVRNQETRMDPEQITQTRSAIRDIARRAGLTPEWADAQIDADATVDQVKAAAFDAQQTRPKPVIRAAVGHSSEDPAVITRRQVEALAADCAGVPVGDEGANQYRGLSFVRHAELTLEGTPGLRFMSESTILETAFTRSAGMQGAADYPLIAFGVANRILGHTYQEAASAIEQKLVTYGTATDFRPVTEIQRGGIPNLQPLTEHGEIQSVSTVEAGTSWKLGTYAGRLDLTRTLLINDDKGFFGAVAADMGRAARRTETQAIVDLLVANPTMADGVALFHVDHGNLGTGSTPAGLTLRDAILSMQTQRGIGGEIIGITPAYLVVAPELQFMAAALLATITKTDG